jgi:heat shock protein HslJ
MVQNELLTFKEVTSTLIACSDQAINDQEGQYLRALQTASRFAINGDTLTIWYHEEGGVLNLTRASVAMVCPSA